MIDVPLSGDSSREPHPLLTPDELKLLDEISGSEDPNATKLRDLVWRLARLKVSEGFFPKYVAVIDDDTLQAFACRLMAFGKVAVGQNRLVWDGSKNPTEHCPLGTKRLECHTSELFLFARPCIRFSGSMSIETRRRLADLGTICVTVENLPIRAYESSMMFMEPVKRDGIHHHVYTGPLSEFLADENGYGVHRQPATLKAPDKYLSGVFSSGTLDDDSAAHPADLGIFLANGTIISIDLNYPILADEVVSLDTGFVMALYSATRKEE